MRVFAVVKTLFSLFDEGSPQLTPIYGGFLFFMCIKYALKKKEKVISLKIFCNSLVIFKL